MNQLSNTQTLPTTSIADMTDLEIFQYKFDCIHSKQIPSGLEVRVSNIDTGKVDARRLIDRLGLNLEVSSEGNMVTYRAFLIKPISAN